MKVDKNTFVIDACQFTSDKREAVLTWCKSIDTSVYTELDNNGNPTLVIPSEEGNTKVLLGDWVIEDVHGKLKRFENIIIETIYTDLNDTNIRGTK